MGDVTGLSNAEADELCQKQHEDTKVSSMTATTTEGPHNCNVLLHTGLSIPTNHVPHQGSTQIVALLHRCAGHDLAGKIGLSRGQIQSLLHGVSGCRLIYRTDYQITVAMTTQFYLLLFIYFFESILQLREPRRRAQGSQGAQKLGVES